MSELVWTRRKGRGTFDYYTADTPLGRIRISRVNKTGVAAFRVYYWDGGQITVSTPEDGKALAEARISRGDNSWSNDYGTGEAPTNG